MNDVVEKRSAIVTGCTGEIGNALVRLLIERQDKPRDDGLNIAEDAQ